MPEPEEEKIEDQPDNSREILEAAYDEAAKEEEPEQSVAVEPETPAAPEEVPAEAAAPEAKEEPETPAEEDSTPEEIDAPAHWAVEHQEMFRGLGCQGAVVFDGPLEGDGGCSYQAQPGNCPAAKCLRALGSLPESNSGGAIPGFRQTHAIRVRA